MDADGAEVRHVVLGAGALGTAIAADLEANDEDVSLYGLMSNPAFDMPGTSLPALDGSVDAVTETCAGTRDREEPPEWGHTLMSLRSPFRRTS